MSFPTSPINGQIAVVNNIAYEYATANSSWTRVLSIANVIQANVISANVLNVVQAFSIAGNIATANYFIGNGAFLTGLPVSYSNTDVANYLPTYTGNLVSLTGPVTTTGNITANNVLFGTGVVSGTGTVYAATVSTTGNVNSGFLSTGEASVGNLFSGGYVSASGNVTGSYIFGNGALLTGVITSVSNINNGTSNVTVVSSGGNVAIGIGGTSNVAVFATTGEYVTGVISASGNIIGGNLSGTNIVGTLTTASQTNITSVGTLGSLTVTANTTSGNLITGGLINATGNITGGNVNTNQVVGTGLTLVSTGDLTLSATGNINVNNEYINNVPTPVADGDAVNKLYVDNFVTGLNVHDAVTAATPTTLATITGGTITYYNGPGSNGVGATLSTTGTFNLIDTVNVQTAGTRILVLNEANAVTNGVYVWSNATAITRASDYNTVPEVEAGDFMFVTSGNAYGNTGWIQTSSISNVGYAGNNIAFTQFSGSGTYNAGTGLTLTGTTFSVNSSQTQVTSVGTLGSLSVTANVTSGNLLTGGLISATGNITGGNLSGTSIVGTLTTAAQTNITSLGTLGSLAVTGNTTSGNFVGTLNGSGANVTSISATNISSGTLAQARLANAAVTLGSTALTLGSTVTTVAGLTSVTSTTFVGALTGAATSATTAGTVTTAAQPNITSVGTLSSVTISGVTSVGGAITRTAAGTGYFNGNYPSVETISTSGAIYSIGGAYVPTASSLNNMYGIGYGYSGQTANVGGSSGVPINRWGMYVASAGVARVFLDSDNSIVYAATFSGVSTTAKYADLAELYSADAEYPPGTVVDFGGTCEITLSVQPGSNRIAGVVSTNPAHLMNSTLESTHTAAIALSGRVPTLVVGPVHKGDMMVSAGNGHAQACATPAMGTVIGKAVEDFVGASGTIEIAVGRL